MHMFKNKKASLVGCRGRPFAPSTTVSLSLPLLSYLIFIMSQGDEDNDNGLADAEASHMGFFPIGNDGYIKLQQVVTKKGKTLLHPMNVLFPEGSVTAIMGPSGSGKTTFLSCLTDSLQSNVQGYAEVVLPGAGAFVPQDDRLHGFYTVKSYMKHYARLCGLAFTPELNTHMDSLIAKLGLTDQANTIVGDLFLKGLSGGQKRRLSVGLEALTDPNNFFLDEPTSGLDSESALQIMEFLREYARAASGRRVILTIHQPSSFIWQKIDNVVLLSKGKLMYQGSPDQMEEFFASNGHPTPEGWNRADHYVTMVNDEFRQHAKNVDEWADLYSQWEETHVMAKHPEEVLARRKHQRSVSMVAASQKAMINTKRQKSSVLAVPELTYRYFLNLWFNPGILGTRIAMYSMLALMVGALFWGLGDDTDYESIISRAAVLFYCVAFFIFMSVAVLPFTVMERGIVDKEVLNKYYNPVAYQLAQAMASIPGAAILAFLVSLVVVAMLKFNDPFWYFLNMFLALCCSEALAQLVSHVVPHFIIGMALLAGLFGFFMLFQGFMIVPSKFPNWLRWTYNVAFHTYSWRSFMVTEFRGEEFVTGPDNPFATGEQVLAFYEIEDVNRSNDMVVLACYCIIIHLMSFAVLYLRHTIFYGHLEPIEKGSGGSVSSRGHSSSKEDKEYQA